MGPRPTPPSSGAFMKVRLRWFLMCFFVLAYSFLLDAAADVPTSVVAACCPQRCRGKAPFLDSAGSALAGCLLASIFPCHAMPWGSFLRVPFAGQTTQFAARLHLILTNPATQLCVRGWLLIVTLALGMLWPALSHHFHDPGISSYKTYPYYFVAMVLSQWWHHFIASNGSLLARLSLAIHKQVHPLILRLRLCARFSLVKDGWQLPVMVTN